MVLSSAALAQRVVVKIKMVSYKDWFCCVKLFLILSIRRIKNRFKEFPCNTII